MKFLRGLVLDEKLPAYSALSARGRKQTGDKPGRIVSHGVWHKPAVLNLVSDFLMIFAVFGLGWALVVWLMSRPLLPLREIVVVTPLAQVNQAQLEYVARTAIHGNFFTVNLESVRHAFETLPWVRQAKVRRRWPDGLELRLEEQQAVAYWMASENGEPYLVNRQGEVFAASSEADMPVLDGPPGTAAWLLARHAEFSQMLAPLDASLSALTLSGREAWQLKLSNDMVILLGREQEKDPVDKRLARFVASWPHIQAKTGLHIAVADLRYPNGFALTPAGQPGLVKGKK